MLSNNNLIDIFKRSLAVTVKSIGKTKDAEINFVTEILQLMENKSI